MTNLAKSIDILTAVQYQRQCLSTGRRIGLCWRATRAPPSAEACPRRLALCGQRRGRPSHVETAGLVEALKPPVEEDLGFALFVALDVPGGPGGKSCESFCPQSGHGAWSFSCEAGSQGVMLRREVKPGKPRDAPKRG